MEFVFGLAIAAGMGWILWSIQGPTAQAIMTWKNGQLTITGHVSAHQKREIQEFFASQFGDVEVLRVTILAHSPSRPTRSRIRIRGVSSEDQMQLIRNFLLSRL